MEKALPSLTPSAAARGRVLFSPPMYRELEEEGYMFADMHFHTNCSDSFTKIGDAVALARKRGTGFAVTDHNLISSAMRATDREDVFVVPGMEISTTDGPHVLTYFYEAKDLQDFWKRHIRPNLQTCPWLALRKFTTEDLLNTVEEEDWHCVVSAAHPMGYFGTNKGVEVCIRKGYLDEDIARRLDAYEVICSGMSRESNLAALDSAARYGIGFTGGTDGHMLNEIGNVVTAVRASDREEFLDGIKKGRSLVIGEEKTAARKVMMGSESFVRFLEHAPSAAYVQTKSGVRSLHRSVKKGAKALKDQFGRFRNRAPLRPGSPGSCLSWGRSSSAR